MRSLILLLAIASLLLGCSEAFNGTGSISKKIGEITSDPVASEVDLPKLTTFGWDEFYEIEEGTPREKVCEFLHAGRNVCGRAIRWDHVPDGHVALIFSLHHKVTHIELHAKEYGVFKFGDNDAWHKKEDAIFTIKRRRDEVHKSPVELEPKLTPNPSFQRTASGGR